MDGRGREQSGRPPPVAGSRAPVPLGRSPQVGRVWDLLALPVAMAVFCLALWSMQPTQSDLIRVNGAAIDRRREQVLAIASSLDATPVRANRCVLRPFVPAPRLIKSDPLHTNTGVIGSSELTRLRGRMAWQDQLDLMLEENFWSLEDLMVWRLEPRMLRRKVGRKEDALVRAALAQRYLVLYGVTVTERVARAADGSARGAVDVQAALFDLDSGQRLCELAFAERIDPRFEAEHDFGRWAHSELWSRTRGRLMRELADLTGGVFNP